MKTETHQFVLKKGKTLHRHGVAQVITRDNLTDEAALFMLHRTPGAIIHFEKFPKDWKEQAAAFDPVAALRVKKNNTPEERQAALKALNEQRKAKQTSEAKKEEPEVIPPGVDESQYNLKKEAMEAKSEDELKAWAAQLGLPKRVWAQMKKPKLIEYLIKETSE
jgi:hypothetical protein